MFDLALQAIQKGIEEGDFPSAAVAIGRGEEVFVKEVYGNRQVKPTAQPADLQTLYDMASLSKLISTTMVALKLIEAGELALYDELQMFFDHCYGKETITVRDLMTHTSGLHPSLPLYQLTKDPAQAADVILQSQLVYATGTQVQYSCMGYILLAKILEKATGQSLDQLAAELVFSPLDMISACYCPTVENVAATEFSQLHQRYLKGEVHDENAHFLGGVSGNAGVFCTLDDLIHFAQMLSQNGSYRGQAYLTERTMETALHNYTGGMEENRGLGFQLKESSYSPAGDLFANGSFGHTGFTGTSLYVDKQTGLYGILLTNAVHYGRDKTGLFRIRRRFYNQIISEYLRIQRIK